MSPPARVHLTRPFESHSNAKIQKKAKIPALNESEDISKEPDKAKNLGNSSQACITSSLFKEGRVCEIYFAR